LCESLFRCCGLVNHHLQEVLELLEFYVICQLKSISSNRSLLFLASKSLMILA